MELSGHASCEITSTLSTLTFTKADTHYRPGLPFFGQVKYFPPVIILRGTKCSSVYMFVRSWYLYMCICLYMSVGTHVRGYTCACGVHIGRLQVDIRSLPQAFSTLFFESGSLTWTQSLTVLASLAGQLAAESLCLSHASSGIIGRLPFPLSISAVLGIWALVHIQEASHPRSHRPNPRHKIFKKKNLIAKSKYITAIA